MLKLLKYVDDSKVLTRTETEEDIINLQNDLVKIYGWAGQNNMKFQILNIISNIENWA